MRLANTFHKHLCDTFAVNVSDQTGYENDQNGANHIDNLNMNVLGIVCQLIY